MLLSAQRCQTLHLICVEDITLSADRVVIEVPHLLKTTRPGHRQDLLVFESYKDNKNICIVQCMREYVSRTEKLRTTKKLLISTIKPYGVGLQRFFFSFRFDAIRYFTFAIRFFRFDSLVR